MILFCVSAALVLIAAAGVIDGLMPDDEYWNQFFGDDQ